MKPLRVDGGGLQVVEAGARLKIQTAVFGVGNQQAAAFERPDDAAAQRNEQAVKFLTGRTAGTVKGKLIVGEAVGAVHSLPVQIK